MPPCGEDNIAPEARGGTGNHSEMVKNMPGIGSGLDTPLQLFVPFKGEPPFKKIELVRDMKVHELEELIEKAVRRVLQGEDIKREFARLQAARKK